MLGNPQSFLCTHPEGLRPDFEQCDRVHSNWTRLGSSDLLDISDGGIFDEPHPVVDRSHDRPVVDLASEPLEFHSLVLYLCGKFYFPEWFRNKLFYLFSLVDAEAKSRSLAWPISNWLPIATPVLSSTSSTTAASTSSAATSSTAGQALLKLRSLEPGECDSKLEVEHLAGIDRDGLVVVWLVLELIERRDNIFAGNGGELGSVDSLHLPGLRDVLLAYVQHFVANVLAFLVAIEPKDHEVHVARDSIEMVGDRTGLLFKFAHSWSVEQVRWILAPVVELLREIAIENMSSNRGHFERCLVAFEEPTVDVDGTRSSNSIFPIELVV